MMRSRSGRVIGITIKVIIVSVVLMLTVGVYLIPRQTQSIVPAEPPRDTKPTTDLGIIYMPLNPGLSAYYDLGVDSGALITGITPDSLADRAGLKVGDVILSYNGTPVEKGSSLLGVMKDCPVGADVVIEVCREKINRTVGFVHTKN